MFASADALADDRAASIAHGLVTIASSAPVGVGGLFAVGVKAGAADERVGAGAGDAMGVVKLAIIKGEEATRSTHAVQVLK